MVLRVVLHEGARGSRVSWICVNFALDWEKIFEIHKQMFTDVSRFSATCSCNPWWAFARFTLARWTLFWIAGVSPQARWAVSMIYAVVTTGQADVRHGKDKTRHEGQSSPGQRQERQNRN